MNDQDLRWNLSSNINRETRGVSDERVSQEGEEDTRRALRRLQKQMEEIQEGSEKKEEWKSKSNQHQFKFNKSILKIMKQI